MAKTTQERWTPTYLNAIECRELYTCMGNRVVESETTNGTLIAVKHKPDGAYVRFEADMMHFASQQGILALRVPACYDGEPEVIAPTTDLVPRESSDKTWPLQVRLFRTITQPYIAGSIARRPNSSTVFTFTSWARSNRRKSLTNSVCEGKVAHGASPWKRLLPGMRAKGLARFVFNACSDLGARNIMAHNGQLSGIYALATVIHDQREELFKRSRFIAAVKDRGR
ncbi:hypothetical protein BDW68DRAFT_193038 [Aspergillus falconensis]